MTGSETSAEPLTPVEFTALMAPLGPFEPAPHLAAAVSGGADSLALALLLQGWAADRDGQVTALIVDHGLRRGSAAEARQVAEQLTDLGLAARVLTRRGPRPTANRQAVARAARYRLLSAWCARHGVLHLALAHHLDDQAETLLLRLGRGSGLDGLAAMAALAESPELRLLRPLLSVPKARLAAHLRARGLAWVEDPSNRDPAHARVRLRKLAPALAREGLTAPRLAATAANLARARAALEQAVAALLARAARPDPAGFVRLDPAVWAAAPRELRLRALARTLMTVGGGAYGPRLAALERLEARILAGPGRGATLGGCRILPRRGGLLIVREAAAAPRLAVAPGQRLLWDGRFAVHLGPAARGVRLGPLGLAGWTALAKAAPELKAVPLPPAARPALPALFDRMGVRLVPHLGYDRHEMGSGLNSGLLRSCRFAPRNPLTATGFSVGFSGGFTVA